MANTPIRAVRVSDQLWSAAKDCAEKDGKTVTDVIIAALTAHVESRQKSETAEMPS